MRRLTIILPLIVLMFSSCYKEVEPNDINQAVVFEYEFENHAWIYTHFGWMIDENGDVKGYTRTDDWNSADENGFISKNDLISNLGMTDTLYFNTDKDKFVDFFEDRFEVLNGTIDTAEQHTADAGVGAMYIYVWDTDKEMYKKQLLASRGDLNTTNQSAPVDSMIKWLKEIGEQTDRFFWAF